MNNISVIEFPGVLRDPTDPSRALAALGGAKAVRSYVNGLQKTSSQTSAPGLTLNFRPANNVSPSNVTADRARETKHLFLLKVPSAATPTITLKNCRSDTSDNYGMNSSELQPNGDNPSDVSRTEAKIVGQVTAFTEFRSLADYQYFPTPEALRPYQVMHSASQNQGVYQESRHRTAVAERVLQSLIERPARNLTLTQCIDRFRPQRIARPAPERGNCDYWYRQSCHNDGPSHDYTLNPPIAFIPGEPLGSDGRSNPQRFARLTHRVPYSVETVPSSPHASDPLVKRGLDSFVKLVSLLRLLFTQRPIWLRRALFSGVPAELRLNFDKAITSVAYCFQGAGPFFQACVKYGYDPRKDPNSRKYQVIEVRCHNVFFEEALQILEQQKKKLNEGRILHEGNDADIENQKTGLVPVSLDLFKMPSEHILNSVPQKKNNFFQMCDINLEPIKTVIESQNLSKTYCGKYGFYTEEAMTEIQKAIKVTLFKEAKKVIGDERSNQIWPEDLTEETISKKMKSSRLHLKDVIKFRDRKLDFERTVKTSNDSFSGDRREGHEREDNAQPRRSENLGGGTKANNNVDAMNEDVADALIGLSNDDCVLANNDGNFEDDIGDVHKIVSQIAEEDTQNSTDEAGVEEYSGPAGFEIYGSDMDNELEWDGEVDSEHNDNDDDNGF